jgi:inositol-phosphate transport system substrate-binding protein
VTVGGAVERAVVKHDWLSVGGQHDVDLYGRRAPSPGRLKRRQRVLRVAQAVSPVAAYVDPPGLAGKEAEGHGGSVFRLCGFGGQSVENTTKPASDSVFGTAVQPRSRLDHHSKGIHDCIGERCQLFNTTMPARRVVTMRESEVRHWKTATIRLLIAALAGGSSAVFASAPALAQTIVKLELWSRQDPSGPLRPANVVKAADRLNKELGAEGSGKRVEVAVHESPAPGFDDDALQLLKVFGIGQGPDMFIAAHEWTCAFQQEGFALRLDDYIAKYPQHFGTIFSSLWQSVKCSDGIYGIPQDAEARMFFYNKKLLREAGYDDAFIEAMPARTLSGELTMDDVIDIGKRVISKTKAQYGILHRPNKGPDYIMAFQSYGNNFADSGTGKLLLERDKLVAAFGWFERGVKQGVIPANNTAMEFDALRKAFYTGNAAFWMYGIWDLGTYAFPTFGLPKDEAGFFADWGWIAALAAKKGGQAGSLTHPIIYAVAAHVAEPELAVRLLGHASDADLNTDHAVTTTHLGIKSEQLKDPRYAEAWPLARATELLKITKFLPNNPQFGDLNGIIYTALQGVETGRLSAQQAADFVIDEATTSLKDVIVR